MIFAGASRTWLGYVIGDYGYVHARNNAFYTAPHLQAGEAENYKIGANFGGDNWQGGVTFFDTRLNNLLSYGSASLTNRTAEYRSKGVTLNGSYDFGGTKIGASYTNADVTGDDADLLPDGDGYLMSVGDTAAIWVDHEITAWNTKIGGSITWAGSIDERRSGSTVFNKQPSYTG